MKSFAAVLLALFTVASTHVATDRSAPERMVESTSIGGRLVSLTNARLHHTSAKRKESPLFGGLKFDPTVVDLTKIGGNPFLVAQETVVVRPLRWTLAGVTPPFFVDASQGRRLRGRATGDSTPPAPPPGDNDSLPLLTDFNSNFTYIGAFKVPSSGCVDYPHNYSIAVASSTALWINDGVCTTKLDIPTLVDNSDKSFLNTASVSSGYSWQGYWGFAEAQIGSSNGLDAQGMVERDGNLLMLYARRYDASNAATKSIFSVPTTAPLASAPSSMDPIWDCTGRPGGSQCQGFVAQYLVDVPSHWRTDLGGDVLAGSANCVSIVGNQSFGMAAFAFNSANVSNTGTIIPATPLAYYPEGNRTWGEYEGYNSTYHWSGNSCINSVVIIPNTRTAMGIGITGSPEYACYGPVTTDFSQVGLPAHDGYVWCWEGGATGVEGAHSWPYVWRYWMVDVKDWKDVKNGTKTYYQPVPYQNGEFTYPYYSIDPNNEATRAITYDPSTKKLYVTLERMWGSDNRYPIVAVWTCTGCP